MRRIQWILTLGGIILLFGLATATLSTNTLNWVVLADRSHTITYGGSCDATHFFFNEIDANFDPDIDGNAAKVKPSANQGTQPPAYASASETYTAFAIPCASTGLNCAFDYNLGTTFPSSAGTHNLEFTSSKYTGLTSLDQFDANTFSDVITDFPNQQFVFKFIGVHPLRVFDLNFIIDTVSTAQSSIVADCAAPTQTDDDMNIYAYDYTRTAYTQIYQHNGTLGSVRGIVRHITVDINNVTDTISNYFGSAPDYNVTFLVRGAVNPGHGFNQCIQTDLVSLQYSAFSESSSYCQSNTMVPLTIVNRGNAAINVDGNFANAFSSVDTNLVLKVWQGSSGCGAGGFGGWQKDCSISTATSPVNTIQCRNYNQFNAQTAGRLATSLAKDTNRQLCFSGDFNGFVPAGAHVKDFTTGSDN